MNANRLRAMMLLHGDNGKSLSKALGISSQRFSAKLNSVDGAEFKQGEIQIIKDRYQLTPEDIDNIFGLEVSK